MSKDPAALLYIDKWLVSTKDMRGAAKGWYLNLILFQYDKGDLPSDIEELANLCDVRISEYDEFKQVFEQVLKQKFELNENNRYENPMAREILRKRETFKEKRTLSGQLGYIIKVATNELKATPEQCEFIKNTLNIDEIDIKDKQVLKQVLKQTIKLYINKDKDVIKDVIKDREEDFKKLVFDFKNTYDDHMLTSFFNYWSQHGVNDKKMLFEKQRAFEISKRLTTWKSKDFNNNKTVKSDPRHHTNGTIIYTEEL